jgi:hypothetical protein
MWATVCDQFCVQDPAPIPEVHIPPWVIVLLVINAVAAVVTCIVSVMIYRVGALSSLQIGDVRKAVDATESGMNACIETCKNAVTRASESLVEEMTSSLGYLDAGLESCQDAVTCVAAELQSSVEQVTLTMGGLKSSVTDMKNIVKESLHLVATGFERGIRDMDRIHDRTSAAVSGLELKVDNLAGWGLDNRSQWYKKASTTPTSSSASTSTSTSKPTQAPPTPSLSE